MRFSTLLYSFVFVSLFSFVCSHPNFVIFAADDLGYDDLSANGNFDVETPNLDKLASQSVSFENFYVNPVCGPTRAGLLTGRHFLRTGVWGVHGTRDYLHLSEQTFADALQTVDYRTGLFGKWHNGVTDGYLPWDRGFQEACMVDLYQYIDNKMLCNRREVQTRGWATARIADYAMDFISRHRYQSFVAMVPFMAPHLGNTYPAQDEYWHAPQHIVQKYRGKGLSDQLSRLYAMIEFMDVQIGRILAHLQQLGLTENTVVLFFSDNGPIGRRLMSVDDWNRRNRHHLRGNKGDIFENGIRVPLYIKWPGIFAPSTVSSALVSIEDIFPTLMELARVGSTRNAIDGRSLVPLLTDLSQNLRSWSMRSLYFTKAAPDWTKEGGLYRLLPRQGHDRSSLVFGDRGSWAIRQGNFKFINHYGNRLLFDLASDPTESNNIDDEAFKALLENEAMEWWNGILRENHSFSRPYFYIGWSHVSTFYLMGAFETSQNIRIRSHSIEGRINPGSYLKFRTIIAATGTYAINIQKWTAFEGQISLLLSCGDQNAYVNGYLTEEFVGSLDISFRRDQCILEVKVESGTGWFQAATLTLTKTS